MHDQRVELEAAAHLECALARLLRSVNRTLRASGLAPQQYQLLMLLKTLDRRPNLGQVAQHLGIAHHSAVGLADRLAKRGLVRRKRATVDRRQVLLQLTPKGTKMLRLMSVEEREQVRSFAPIVLFQLKRVLRGGSRPAKNQPLGMTRDEPSKLHTERAA